MILRSQIHELHIRWQTTELNVAREYVQHLLLSALYGGIREEAALAFKGGTALRLLRQSPRFSEDLDFTGWAKGFHVDRWIRLAHKEAAKSGLDFTLRESSPTSGGWFALSETKVHDWPVPIEWNISLRGRGGGRMETVLVTSPMGPPYSVRALPIEEASMEKVEALLRRKEPRDFFDLYFLLRSRLGVSTLLAHKKVLSAAVKTLEPKRAEKELKLFLPRSHWALLRHLPGSLAQELERL